MGYIHLSIYERGRIEELARLGFSRREIASNLDHIPSTIFRELRKSLYGKVCNSK